MLNIKLNSNWLFAQAKLNPGKVAVIFDNYKFTYDELTGLVKKKVYEVNDSLSENDIIGINADHSTQFIIDLFAVWSLGASVFPINPKLTKKEIEEQKNLIGYRTLAELNNGNTRVKTEETFSPGKRALIMLTSGSTGKRKAVVHTFNSLYSSAESIDKIISFQRNEKWLASLPFYRIGGFQIIVRSMLSGGTICLPNQLNTNEIIKSISLCRPQFVSLVNASLKDLLSSRVKDLQNTKAVFVGGGPVNSNLLLEALQKEIPLYKVYGSTETGSMISLLEPKDAEQKIESAGKPLPGVELQIIDNEVCVSSDSLFSGYYRNEELAQAKFIDKWYRTGDEGYIDDNGFLYIKNRLDNLIISGGEKINPNEIENTLLNFDGIENAIVFGIEDEKWGEKICAVITAQNEIDFSELINFLKEKLASYKVPKEIKQIEKIPFDEMGKIKREELMRLFS